MRNVGKSIASRDTAIMDSIEQYSSMIASYCAEHSQEGERDKRMY